MSKPAMVSGGGDFNALRDQIDALRKDLTLLMEHVKSGASRNLADDSRAGGVRGTEALVQQVEDHPLTSLLVAFGLGLIGGKLTLR